MKTNVLPWRIKLLPPHPYQAEEELDYGEKEEEEEEVQIELNTEVRFEAQRNAISKLRRLLFKLINYSFHTPYTANILTSFSKLPCDFKHLTIYHIIFPQPSLQSLMTLNISEEQTTWHKTKYPVLNWLGKVNTICRVYQRYTYTFLIFLYADKTPISRGCTASTQSGNSTRSTRFTRRPFLLPHQL